jgi:hypothetical protein
MPDLRSYLVSGFPKDDHDYYRNSMFWGVAPEYATSEVLLGGAYREFVVAQSDGAIDLDQISELPDAIGLSDGELEMWRELVGTPTGLASPSPAGQKSRAGIRQSQLMPLVPEVARHANVLGSRRSRWRPGALVATTIAAGVEPRNWRPYVTKFADALRVDATDDLLARYLDARLGSIGGQVATIDASAPPAPWRTPTHRLTPAERFVTDLTVVITLKPSLTRRQWTVLAETALRIGLGLHLMWLMRLNWGAWTYLLSVSEGEEPMQERVDALWESHHVDPLLEAGADSGPQLRRVIQKFIEARLGINVLLKALDEAGQGWPHRLGTSGADTREELQQLALHVAANRSEIDSALDAASGRDLRRAVGAGIDARPRMLGLSSGFSKNIREFLRYSLGQLVPDNPEYQTYDQGYLLVPDTRRRGPGRVELGPTALIYLTTVAALSLNSSHVSVDAFREHLGAYGLWFPAGELGTGKTITSLERLGLTIESPDAGGGRTIMSPLMRAHA